MIRPIRTIDWVIFDKLFEFVGEVKEGTLLCNTDGSSVSNKVNPEFIRVVKALNTYPSSDPLFECPERLRFAGETFIFALLDQIVTTRTAALHTDNFIKNGRLLGSCQAPFSPTSASHPIRNAQKARMHPHWTSMRTLSCSRIVA